MAVGARSGFVFQFQFKSTRPVSEGHAGVYLGDTASRIKTVRELRENKAQLVEEIGSLPLEDCSRAELLHSVLCTSSLIGGGHRIMQFNAQPNRSFIVRSRGSGETHANITVQSIARCPSRA